jgi:hypothetical protein
VVSRFLNFLLFKWVSLYRYTSATRCSVGATTAGAAPSTASPTPIRRRRLSIAFFHKANYDAVIDPSDFVPGCGADGGGGGVSGRNPAVESGDISRVGLLHKVGAVC